MRTILHAADNTHTHTASRELAYLERIPFFRLRMEQQFRGKSMEIRFARTRAGTCVHIPKRINKLEE